MKQMLNKN